MDNLKERLNNLKYRCQTEEELKLINYLLYDCLIINKQKLEKDIRIEYKVDKNRYGELCYFRLTLPLEMKHYTPLTYDETKIFATQHKEFLVNTFINSIDERYKE